MILAGNIKIGIALIIPAGILVLLGSIGIIEVIRLVKRKMDERSLYNLNKKVAMAIIKLSLTAVPQRIK